MTFYWETFELTWMEGNLTVLWSRKYQYITVRTSSPSSNNTWSNTFILTTAEVTVPPICSDTFHNTLPSPPPLTFRSHPQLSHWKAWRQLFVRMRGCRTKRDQIDLERLCDSVSSQGHAFCPHPPGWLAGDLGVPLAEAGYHRLHLHAVGSSGEKVD